MDIDAWDVAAVAVKATTYLSTLGGAGGVFFIAYSADVMRSPSGPQIRRLVMALLALGIIASLVRIFVLAGSMRGEVAGMVDWTALRMIARSGEGGSTDARMAGLAIAGFALFITRRRTSFATLGAALGVTSFAWVGHAHAQSPPPNAIPMALVSLHVLGAAFWLGALPPLLIVARDRDAALLARAAQRFGRLAIGVVGALIVAGGVLLGTLLARASDLWTTDYGRLFVIKLGLVGCLLGLAAYHKLRLTPRLLALDAHAPGRFARSLRVEIGVGLALVLVAAALTTVTGPAAGTN